MVERESSSSGGSHRAGRADGKDVCAMAVWMGGVLGLHGEAARYPC
jgi:hypothetical protein